MFSAGLRMLWTDSARRKKRKKLVDSCSRCDVPQRDQEGGRFTCGEQHAVAFFAPELRGFEVDDDDDLFADHFFRGVVKCNAGDDLADFFADVHL